MAASILVFTSSSSYALSYTSLNQAIREYNENPTPDTQARLTAAQHKAMMLDFGIIAVPVALIGYILVRGFIQKKKSESVDASL